MGRREVRLWDVIGKGQGEEGIRGSFVKWVGQVTMILLQIYVYKD